MQAIVPLRSFDTGNRRLAARIPQDRLAGLAHAVADHVVDACRSAGMDVSIVTADSDVANWAAGRATVVTDPGLGLDAACSAGVAATGARWLVVHADLPLIDAVNLAAAAAIVSSGRSVIAPSRDGGTNVLGQTEPIEFAYGPGSFHRHLAVMDTPPTVLVRPETLIEIDTPADLHAAASLPGGEWLRPFLG